MMQENFGQKLKYIRESKKLTINNIAKQLFLCSQRIIEIENDDYSHMISPIFARGYLKKYAKFLGIADEEIQEEFQYFYDLWKSDTKYPRNQHNLIVPYLLGIVDDFDINKEPAFEWGELPDIDLDYVPIVRDWLKMNGRFRSLAVSGPPGPPGGTCPTGG
jgi:transcriptional regulator with XRE-family HTH domain